MTDVERIDTTELSSEIETTETDNLNDCDSDDERESEDENETNLSDSELIEDDDEDYGQLDYKPRNEDEIGELPKTVTKLVTADGSSVYLVGTAHFSTESQNDVSKTIQQTQPNVVVLELCNSRMNILKMDEETILRDAKDLSLAKIRVVIKENGLMHGVMYLFLLKMSAHITEQLGMAPGGEFRRAFQEARRVPGCMVHLGDRPIQITIQRALSELTWWQKIGLAWNVLHATNEPITKEEVEKSKNKDLIEELLAEMTTKYPSFSKVLVQERDIYLANALRLAASPLPCRNTESGFMPAVVVGVVGMGHISGIVSQWDNLDKQDISELLRIPPATLASRVFKYSVKASACALTAWGLYRLLGRPPILNFISKPFNGK